jgi:hypothetical protein
MERNGEELYGFYFILFWDCLLGAKFAKKLSNATLGRVSGLALLLILPEIISAK